MDFQCKLCTNKYFASNKHVIEHLKKLHGVKESINQIGCTVKNSKCGKYFRTFQGLTRHVSKCIIQLASENEPERGDDSAHIPENEVENQNSYIFYDSSDGMDLSSTNVSTP